MQIHKDLFPVRSFDVDAWAVLSVPALMGYLQEVAVNHATELGCGVSALMQRGLTWVFVGERVEVLEAVHLGETVEVSTWPSGRDRRSFSREYIVRREGGVEVARATSRWLVLDVATRRPAEPDGAIDSGLSEEAERVMVMSSEGVPELGDGWERRLPVRYADIDINAHVTSTAYVMWALEATPEDIWRACRVSGLEVQFRSECYYGGSVLSRAAASGERELLHAIIDGENGRELARLRTSWVPRGAV